MLVQNGVRARCQKHAITIRACQSAILALHITLYFYFEVVGAAERLKRSYRLRAAGGQEMRAAAQKLFRRPLYHLVGLERCSIQPQRY